MWRLLCDRGRQVWEYVQQSASDSASPSVNPQAHLYDPKKNLNSSDLVYRTAALAQNYQERTFPEDIALPKEKLAANALQAAFKAINFYQALQADDGHWPGDYGGPLFLMPGLIIAAHSCGVDLGEARKAEMVRYLTNRQRPDGGWGMHLESNSTMFGSVLNYCAMRLLGVGKDDARVVRARDFIKRNGGATYCPSWGKFWLCVLGVFEYEGINSLFPELWLFPRFLPFHPSRYWCHCRMVYLPMAYCFGRRLRGPLTPLVHELREEIHVEPYHAIRWASARDRVSPVDRYFKPPLMLRAVFAIINAYELLHVASWRQRALDFIAAYVDAEDSQTNYIDIGPVNKVINMLCVYDKHGPKSEAFRKHVDRLWDYLWLAEDGMKMQGYNGSQLWDTAFAVQAIVETGMAARFERCVRKAYRYFEMTQTIEETPDREKFFRHISKGAWPFSTRAHGWPISDCTSEGMKATLLLHRETDLKGRPLLTASEPRISDERLFDGVNVILSYQNTDGGWATYENTRGPAWLELLNPSEVFGEIMIDYSYVECTSACVQSLLRFRQQYPLHRRKEIDASIVRGLKFIEKRQRPDGSWYGSWAVCFTYAAWFAAEAIVATGGTLQSSFTLQRGCEFLLQKQNKDGGWGESYQSCVTKQYVPHEQSQVVNTCWALLALMAADCPDPEPIRRGIQLVLSRQRPDGDWAQESVSGVFNGNCMITYTAYRNVFPIWALGRYFNGYARRH